MVNNFFFVSPTGRGFLRLKVLPLREEFRIGFFSPPYHTTTFNYVSNGGIRYYFTTRFLKCTYTLVSLIFL